jgi:hypothetical protein
VFDRCDAVIVVGKLITFYQPLSCCRIERCAVRRRDNSAHKIRQAVIDNAARWQQHRTAEYRPRLVNAVAHQRFPSRSAFNAAFVSFRSCRITRMCLLTGFWGSKLGHIFAASEFVLRGCSEGVGRSAARWGQIDAAIVRLSVICSYPLLKGDGPTLDANR